MVKEKPKSLNFSEEELVDFHELILFNDDVNTFDFVIDTLIELCNHDPISAEQCALIVHFKGKCSVKSGDLYELKPIGEEMSFRGLTVSIS
jgi:ATP-dependent Clp protease adaptor protein ClpS